MAQQKTQSAEIRSSQHSCEGLKEKLHRKHRQLWNWEHRLDNLLDNPESSLREIADLSALINSIKNEISQLESDRRRLGCETEERPHIAFDNQTVISTSSVRRKSREDLLIKQPRYVPDNNQQE